MNQNNETSSSPQNSTLLSQFQRMGLFAATEVRPEKVELQPGVIAEFHVRELADAEFRRLWADGDRAKLIAATICDADGKPVMTEKQAAQLRPLVAVKLQDAAMKHAGFGEEARDEAEKTGNS